MPWSMILKVVRPPTHWNISERGDCNDVAHWNYWKREVLVYGSGLLNKLPPGFAAPRCFGIEQRPNNVYWLWLEDIQGVYPQSWTLDQYALAARHLGRFGGAYLTRQTLPSYLWLSRGLLRQWCALLPPDLPHASSAPVPGALSQSAQLLDLLDHLPQTLCHRDVSPANLVARHSANHQETVALDWALAGLGPVGEDLAQLALGAVDSLIGTAPGDVSQDLFDGYLCGLEENGWYGDGQSARLGYTLSAVIRGSLEWIWLVRRAKEQGRAMDTLVKRQLRTKEFLRDCLAQAASL
jgi:hypothetical protein